MPGESKVVKIVPGVAVPEEVYGAKAAGYSQLVELRPQCLVSYQVPEAWAVPLLTHGGFPFPDIRQAFTDLTRGLTQGAVLMARGSEVNEKPGKSPTLFTYYDPKDVKGSLERFAASAGEVLEASPT